MYGNNQEYNTYCLLFFKVTNDRRYVFTKPFTIKKCYEICPRAKTELYRPAVV